MNEALELAIDWLKLLKERQLLKGYALTQENKIELAFFDGTHEVITPEETRYFSKGMIAGANAIMAQKKLG